MIWNVQDLDLPAAQFTNSTDGGREYETERKAVTAAGPSSVSQEAPSGIYGSASILRRA